LVLHGKSGGCALGIPLLAGIGEVSENPPFALGWSCFYTPLPGSQILLLFIGGVSLLQPVFCALYFYHSSNSQLQGREILASPAAFPRVKISG